MQYLGTLMLLFVFAMGSISFGDTNPLLRGCFMSSRKNIICLTTITCVTTDSLRLLEKVLQLLMKVILRASARACVEDSLGWASSVFPTNEVKARSVSKLPSLGKHKLSISDSMKPSKAKFKKSSMEHSEIPHLISEPLLEPLPAAALSDPFIRFDGSQPIILDVGIDDVGSNLSSVMDKELSMGMESLEAVPHHYVSGLISGLDDCPLLPEYTDID